MKYKAYKLAFTSGIHIGKTMLVDSNPGIHADTLFSALCQEALKIGEIRLLSCMGMPVMASFRYRMHSLI